MVKRQERTRARHLRREWALAPPVATTILFLIFGKRWLADLSNGLWFGVVSLWLVGAILVSALSVVRHAEGVAERVREPLGTLVLTLAMSGMEMLMIAAVMYSGKGAPALARDTMMAIVMIVLNGLVGTSLLVGGLRYHEQTTNLYGPNAFLGVLLPLSVLGLVLPRFTRSSAGPTYSSLQALFLILMSVGLYAVFLAIQTRRHREYFIGPEAGASDSAQARNAQAHAHDSSTATLSAGGHVLLLVAYAVPVVLLAKQIARPIDHAINDLGAPAALGGLLVAGLILSPESLAAVRAARANQLQRSMNLALGTALSSISLTIPAVLAIGLVTGTPIVLGLEPPEIVLLLLSMGVSILTFALERTNILQGAIHLLLFLAYLMLIFD
jgi:Ca2+:H+ antiporter